MGRFEKQLDQLRDPRGDAGWDFHGLCGLLKKLGFEMRVNGSHHFFRRSGVLGVINLQPNGRHAKTYQVRQTRAVLQQQGLL